MLSQPILQLLEVLVADVSRTLLLVLPMHGTPGHSW
jgi:hypothetical protein